MYYGNDVDWEYKGQEHIIPAGLGGKRRLPMDYVSANFNNAISKLEQDFIRNSLPSIARQIEGPGKRGSLTERYETKSPVNVFRAGSEGSELASLGFVRKGVPFEIPQIRLNLNSREVGFSSDKSEGKNIEDVVEEFKNACANPALLRFRVMPSSFFKPGEVVFGIKNGIEENFNAFMAHHPDYEVKLGLGELCDIGKKLSIAGKTPEHLRYQPKVHGQVKFDIEHFRIYGKMAFNYLAYHKGLDFVQRPIFDALRNWIAFGGENQYATFSKTNPSWLWMGDRRLPPSSHLAVIFKQENVLYALVILYSTQTTQIMLSNKFDESFGVTGYICDWKGQAEYDMFEYLQTDLSSDIR